MSIEPEKLTVSINDRDSVTALLYLASKRIVQDYRAAGHGAEEPAEPVLELFANGLAARGLTRCLQLLSQNKTCGPDPKPSLNPAIARGRAALMHRMKGNRLVIAAVNGRALLLSGFNSSSRRPPQ